MDSAPRWLERLPLSFRDFVEHSLFDPEEGYYRRPRAGGDYATAVDLSPAYSFALARLMDELAARLPDGLSAAVDVGCGDGSLLAGLRDAAGPGAPPRFLGVDRSLGRLRPELAADPALEFLEAIPPLDGPAFVVSNELFDAVPWHRVVQREEGLRELWTGRQGETLAWEERPAPPEVAGYFEARGIRLDRGQFADITPGWGELYRSVLRAVPAGLAVTVDYGFPQERLFDVRVRRWGTAVAFHRHELNRDLLARPGRQDLTAHVNFTDLMRAGEAEGWSTLAFMRQASFLLAIGIADHPLFTPLEELRGGEAGGAMALAEAREQARRLVLPDGIGDEMRVLVQGRGVPLEGWSFQKGGHRELR